MVRLSSLSSGHDDEMGTGRGKVGLMDAMVAEGNAHLHRAHINIFFHFYSSSPLAHSPLLQEALLVLVLHHPDL